MSNKIPGIPEALAKLLESAKAAGAQVRVMDGDELFAEGEKSPAPLPEARIMGLQETAELFHSPNPFKVGDIITPRKASSLKGHGTPHIVLEVFDPPYRSWHGNPAGGDFGKLVNIRVLGIADGPDGDSYVPWCGESFQYETFDPTAKYED